MTKPDRDEVSALIRQGIENFTASMDKAGVSRSVQIIALLYLIAGAWLFGVARHIFRFALLTTGVTLVVWVVLRFML